MIHACGDWIFWQIWQGDLIIAKDETCELYQFGTIQDGVNACLVNDEIELAKCLYEFMTDGQ